MLSRRVSSSIILRYNENIGPDKVGDNGDVDRPSERRVVEHHRNPALPASTETSTASRRDSDSILVAAPRHVEHMPDIYDRKQHPDMYEDAQTSEVLSDRRAYDVSLAMSYAIKNYRETQRARDSSRHRRRKSVEKLDRNVDVFQINCSATIQRVATSHSNISEIADSPKTGIAVVRRRRAVQYFVNDTEAECSVVDDHGNPSTSIYPKIPDNDNKISRKRSETFGTRDRINCHRNDDNAIEHKDRQRRNYAEDKRRVETLAKATPRTRKPRTVWPGWASQKRRWLLVLGLAMWTTLMITEVAGRQSHHRTCPGCPHQHVHTINRKAGNYEDGTAETSGDTEHAPSPDDLRLEAIKHQILTKLGLRTRPDVNRTLASVPRHLALETLYRAEAQPPGHSNEPDDYHEARRRPHRHGDSDDELSPLSPSSSSSSSSLSSSSSSLSSSSSSSASSASSSSSLSSSSKSSSSSSSYGQFYYDGEEYSYRNVDQDALEREPSSKGHDDVRESTETGSYVNKGRHRGHGDYRNGGKARDYHVSNTDDNDDDEGQIEMDDFYARTSEIISFAEPGRTLNGQPLLEFPQSSGDPALEPLRIKRATLWARVEYRHAHHYQHHRRAQTNQRNITLWVFRVRCGNVTHLRGKELGEHLEMVTSLGVNVNQLGWQKFDVTRVVSNWYSGHELTSSRNEKLTLLVDCTGCGSHVHVSTFGVQAPQVVESSINPKGGEDPDRPFLVVRTDPAAVKRVRRRAIECSGAIKGQCCKQRFYVSFSQLGWDDWIIAPQGYYANYCRGDCAAGHRTPDTFLNYYTHVIEEYRKMDRLAGMQPCCAPLKFSPMSLIYYGPDSNIIKRDLPKMVVDECGCP